MAATSKDEVGRIRSLIEEQGIEVVILGAADVNGVFRGKRVPAWKFTQDPTATIKLSDYTLVADVTDFVIPREAGYEGWWPEWEGGFGDMEGVPDLSTFRVVPWLSATGLALCDFRFRDGSPIEVMPREILRQVTARAEAAGLFTKMAAEFEFHLLRETDESAATKAPGEHEPLAPRPQFYGISRQDLDEHIVRLLRDNVEGFSLPVDAWTSEGGPGQYELNLHYCDVFEAADRAFLFRHAVKQVASLNGLMATFMAKINTLSFGSSLHVHHSVWSKKGENLLFDPTSEDRLTPLAHSFIGGQVATLPDFTVLFAPTVNSYKRLTPESAAGTSLTWGYQNKTVSVRVLNDDAASCRLEHRTAGGDANPYLVMAAMLAGGLHGVEKDVKPPPAVTGNAYADPSLPLLPPTLSDAISRFEDSEVANEYLGEGFVKYFAATRRWEQTQFQAAVTDWETKRYLSIY